MVGQESAVLAAGMGLKLSDFRGIYFNFNGVLPGN